MTATRPRLRSLMLTAIACITPAAWAQAPVPAPLAAPRTKPVAAADAHRPTPIPDRIVRTIAADPARTIAVSWRTDASVAAGLAQIAAAEPGPRFPERAKTVSAASQTLATNLNSARFHSVVFRDLSPSTAYVYRVGDGVDWSEWYQVRTASDKPEPFRFLYFGDAQNDIKSMWSRVIRRAYADAPDAAFMVHAGDLVNRGWDDALWGEWFAAGGWVDGMVANVPSPGNHEYERPRLPDGKVDPNAKALFTPHWRAQFALPENGPPGLEEAAYFFDYQGVRVVSLNSNEAHREQAEWLDRVLAENPQTWTIVTFHHPIYSPAKNRDNPELRALWQPVFDRRKVDLVLQGHDHTYARTGLKAFENVPEGANTRDDPTATAGTVYVVSVAGPKMYVLDPEHWMRRAGEDVQLYQVIAVDGGVLRYEARTALGDPYDAFELHKQPDGRPNRLVDRVPATPEIRRAVPKAAAAG
ncbi:purple acid phosphatase family protein [Paludisphaera mucosa]|uniref:Metallophosphoesterase family protein n=1 Tax=Paludisphaera mucosa TaxID=3030827 RepID=A0ABT6F4Q7_9BACT|nr:metallophosphoesterase family protein [Paludisphaera mucosa]MDG3002486.1 metallophosphoesterase family protein [Paludisphaera mucosa]